MPTKKRIYDDKTVVVNYLMTSYTPEGATRENRSRKRIITEAADQIFQIHFFHRDPESAEWHARKIVEILERMERKLGIKPPAIA